MYSIWVNVTFLSCSWLISLPYLWSWRSGCWGSWSAPSRGSGSWTGWGRSPGWGAPAGSCWPTGRPAGPPGRGDARWSPRRESCCSGRCHWSLPELDRNRSASSTRRCCSGLSYWSWFAWYGSDSWWRGGGMQRWKMEVWMRGAMVWIERKQKRRLKTRWK